MKKCVLLLCLFVSFIVRAQSPVDLSGFNKKGEAKVSVQGTVLTLKWPAGNKALAELQLDLANNNPLFKTISLNNKQIASGLDPAFILTVGKRDLISQNGWNIFFDKVPKKPYKAHNLTFSKNNASVRSEGAHTIVRISEMNAPSFTGDLEITVYNGSPLFNTAAVITTQVDSTAILFDAGLVTKKQAWENIAWSDTKEQLQQAKANLNEISKNLEVKYRTVIGENANGSLALFPPPHQYFYPLDEAFNLKFTWYGKNYRNMIPDFGIGIRQELEGDKRFVPWFNSPPGTRQRLNFFCLLNTDKAQAALNEVKKFTNADAYVPLPGYKTMASHFHNEFIMNVVMAGKPIPENPNFVQVFKRTGVDIVHLGEFHYTAHPKGPDEQRLKELHALFQQCERLSDSTFLLLPGEEPNEFFGGHWMNFFPKSVYWIMSRKPDMPFVTDDSTYGKVYRIADKNEMLKLLEAEKGLAWTAHARTKGSTGYPDKYKEEAFFKSDRFMGAAWKDIPADLSTSRLSNRVLQLLDDMNNWGLKKHIIAESDLFTIEPENEMYAHLNVNYLQLDKLPTYKQGWQPVLDAMQNGKFFSGTGEVLLPSFTVNGKGSGETVQLPANGKATIKLDIRWTFPLNFAEVISGDGKQVYREKVNLNYTTAFGKKQLTIPVNLKNRTWVRVEVWDAAVNGAFTQSVYLD